MVRGGPSRATANYSAGAQRGAVDGAGGAGRQGGLFRYMLAAASRLNSSLLIANAWHARSDAASSLVVALGLSVIWPGSPGSTRSPRWRWGC